MRWKFIPAKSCRFWALRSGTMPSIMKTNVNDCAWKQWALFFSFFFFFQLRFRDSQSENSWPGDLALLTSSTNPLSRVKRHPTEHWLFDSQSKAPVLSSVLPWSSAWWHLDWKCPESWTHVNSFHAWLQNKADKSSEHLTALGGKLRAKDKDIS